MEHVASLGRSILKVPRMGIGALSWGQPSGLGRWTLAQLTYGPSDGAKEEELALEVSLAAGVNLIDTAELYSKGASERRVGELAHGRDVILATKFPPSSYTRIENFPSALVNSLSRLNRSFIDLYQVHFPSRWLPIPQLMNLMADSVEAGKVRAVGVSNYSATQMRLAHSVLSKRGIPLASNQVSYSLLYREPEINGVLDTCRELGITLIAYHPLAMGALTGKYSVGTRSAGLRHFFRSFRSYLDIIQPVLFLLREIGERYSKSPTQVALRWLIENENVLPIPGVKNSCQVAENVGALSFSLSKEEIEVLNQATNPWRKSGK